MASSLLKDLIDRTQRLADRVDPSYRGRALDALDEAVQWYASQMPWRALQRTEDFFALGQYLVLPDRVNKVITIGDRTNSRPLNPGDSFERRRPGSHFQKTPGASFEWRTMGYAPLVKEMAGETQLLFSTATSEAINVSIAGLVNDTAASGTALALREAKEVISLGGSTEASTQVYTRITSIQKDKGTTNDLVIGSAADGLLSRIPSWETRPLFRNIELSPRSSGQTMEVTYFRRPDRLTQESDTIDPGINEEAILWRAVGNMHWIDQEGQQAERAWKKASEAAIAKRTEEETFGEIDLHVEPWAGYMSLENEFWYD